MSLYAELALSYVVWPPTKLSGQARAHTSSGKSRWSDEHRRQAFELADAGVGPFAKGLAGGQSP